MGASRRALLVPRALLALCRALPPLCLVGLVGCDASDSNRVDAAVPQSALVGPVSRPNQAAAPLGPALLDCPQCEAVRERVDAAALEIARERAALGVVLVVVDVPTGGLLAVGDYGGASLRAFMPSGTLRPLVLAAAIEEGADPAAVYPGGDGALYVGGMSIRESMWFGDGTMRQMVGWSAVVGPVLLAREYLGDGRWGDWLVRLGLMDPSDVGPIPWGSSRTMFEATGHERDVSPTAVARAYAVLANDGQLPDGRQLMHVETARATRDMLEWAVADDGGTGMGARVPGVRVGGKTSCAWWMSAVDHGEAPTPSRNSYCSFVGMLPMEAPRLVLLVGIEDAGLWEGYTRAAAPGFARLAPQLLALLSDR